MIGAVILTLLSAPLLVESSFSLYYFTPTEEDNIIHARQSISVPSKADHVADIYTRISGHAPILREDSLHLPTKDVFSTSSKKPLIVEVQGGSLPQGMEEVAQGRNLDGVTTGPTVESVVSVLKLHGINAEGSRMQGSESEIADFIRAQNAPVFVIHQEAPRVSRHLAASNQTVDMGGPDEFEISQYQITAFTGLGMIALLLSGVCMISGMEVIPDSLLYAKFQSARTQKID
mmetsp:Transcript_28946/g.29290  ORF Transcript_28946/g.29290 Transcript_28946/m.29290 type:complete len:232 (+) Transcript_28946:81-776(+)|eukprot:CAMPEP_0182420824 /NCGR_PEP_ID=MMETSP1167-20130531/5912_1 /TAXON_ID=2988 /ORGANISM="Mallomonas Sp, Strain CCMP3275" /LENGTH=231 /DNA_ID=CAMNT_0024597311 /DNA_START=71 /DNA_END=766 /DNA_ORIENTATION=-